MIICNIYTILLFYLLTPFFNNIPYVHGQIHMCYIPWSLKFDGQMLLISVDTVKSCQIPIWSSNLQGCQLFNHSWYPLYLVGAWATPLKNDGVSNSWDDDIPNWME